MRARSGLHSAVRARGTLAALAMTGSLALAGCGGANGEGMTATGEAERQRDELSRLRERMVAQQIEARGVRSERVLEAMRRVPRHAFAPETPAAAAYDDRPHPIGHGQTISQPYIVALMTELADIAPGERVLEVGTGSGYQAAVLGEIADEVYSIEIVEPLAERARAILAERGYDNVHVRAGDGYRGWPEAAPFDAILVTAAAPRVPQPLVDQLAVGGRLVIPVDAGRAGLFGSGQWLELHIRTEDGIERDRSIPVRFVPMTGEVRGD